MGTLENNHKGTGTKFLMPGSIPLSSSGRNLPLRQDVCMMFVSVRRIFLPSKESTFTSGTDPQDPTNWAKDLNI